jgi:site-specific DNA recombinase
MTRGLTVLSNGTSLSASRKWRQKQKRLADQITEYQEAERDYVQDGIGLLELSNKACFLCKHQDSSEKRELLNFMCSNSIWKDHTLTATFRQPFDLLAITNTTWQREKAAGADSSDLRPIWLPTLDNLRNFLLTPTTEVLSFFQQLREAP